jgi:hypothetical protein
LRFNFSSVDSGFIVVMEASNIAEWLQISWICLFSRN